MRSGDWQLMSKPELIDQLATAARQLTHVRDELRQATLKLDLLAQVQRTSSPQGLSDG